MYKLSVPVLKFVPVTVTIRIAWERLDCCNDSVASVKPMQLIASIAYVVHIVGSNGARLAGK